MTPRLPQTHFQACIFDFDGVLVDSEPLHAQAKQITLEHFQVPYPPRLLVDWKGRPDEEFFQHVALALHSAATAVDLAAYKHHVYLNLFENVPVVPGALEFLSTARARFPKLGLATSATRRDFGLAASKYQLTTWFDVIITGEDTLAHKPDPAPYQKALSALNAASQDTLVIEDSPNGVRAAKSAGCTAIALTTSFNEAELRAAGADAIVGSFSALEDLLAQ